MPHAKAIIKTVAEFLGRVIIPIPPSRLERSNIEIACKNRVFHRIAPRPRRHDENKVSIAVERETIKIVDFPVGQDVLIVDDICTTGRTMLMYRDWCLELGAKSVECLAYGRVKPQQTDRLLAIAVVEVGGFDLDDLTEKLDGFSLNDTLNDAMGNIDDLFSQM